MLSSLLEYLPYFCLSLSPGEFLLAITLDVTTFSGLGLIAIWAGLGQPHWFVRMAGVVALSAIPLVIPAYELVVQYWIQFAVTILPLLILRRYRLPAVPAGEAGPVLPGRAQVFLRDLLLLTALAAGVSAIVARIPRDIWVGLGRSRWWIRLIAVCLLSPAALIALFLCLMRIAYPSDKATRRPWISHTSQAALAALIVLMLLPPSYAVYKLLTPLPIPTTTLPTPNGYADLIQAAQPLANVVIPTEADSSEKTLRPFVLQYRGQLEKAHAALQQSCQGSLRYEWSDWETSVAHGPVFRQLARAFDAEAVLAHREGRNDEASRIAFDQFRLSDAVSRGRLITGMLVGSAIEGIGACRIATIRDSLSADQCRELIDALQEIEAEREPLEEVIARDMAWEDHAYPWQGRLMVLASRMAGSSIPNLEFADSQYQARRQLLLGELALHIYTLEHGEPPTALADLVPQYLPTLPKDPFSGNPLIYRRTSTGCLLYSVGYDGKDDGGRPATPYLNSPGDMFLDEPSATGAKTSQSGNPGP
jgi:hypothetical protein